MRIGRKLGNLGVAGFLLLAAAALIATVLLPRSAAAQASEQVLYNFCTAQNCPDGADPLAGLVMDATGNLYGATLRGGTTPCVGDPDGCGVIFQLAPDGTQTVLHRFSGPPDGAFPGAGLVMDAAGNLYGTTYRGGTNTGNCLAVSCGTVFQVGADGTYTVLYRFAGSPGGEGPSSGLIMDAAGNLYGTTQAGGTAGQGVVFQLAPDGTETVLHSFCQLSNCTDGTLPLSDLVLDAAGNLYGAARSGDGGVVFQLAPDGAFTILRRFCQLSNCRDGKDPVAGLAMDAAGYLYGATSQGGLATCSGGCGTVFKLAPDGTSFALLHSFAGSPDGANPNLRSGLVIDAAGNLYGTTEYGGGRNVGVVFQVAPSGGDAVLYSFCPGFSCVDGAHPASGLIMDAAGNLYGTTQDGGADVRHSRGVVFAVTPGAGTSTSLANAKWR